MKNKFDIARLRELFSYDPISGKVCRLTTRNAGKACGTLLKSGHLQTSVDGKLTGVHRIAWALQSGEYPEMEIDHINGNGADNRLCNLRLATSSQNNQNRRLSTRNTTGVKGVFRVKRGKQWRVSVCVNGKYHITHFNDFDIAVGHAKAIREKLHREFARAC